MGSDFNRAATVTGLCVWIAATAGFAADAPLHSWQFVGVADESALFVDDVSVVSSRDSRTAWVILVNGSAQPPAPAPGESIAYAMAAHKVNCATRTDQIPKVYVYAKDRNILTERSDVYPEMVVVPYSTGERVFDYVCRGVISTDKVAKLTNLEDVIEFGHNYVSLMDALQKLQDREKNDSNK